MGEINNFRQGLENGTGRFGGTPNLILSGVWLGGYRVNTSIVRGISDVMTGALFEAGTGFAMSSRFKTDLNADLGASAALLDFSPANFPNPSTLQLNGMIVTRNGVPDASDSTTTPNIDNTSLASSWRDNVGLPNTFEGGRQTISTEVATSNPGSGVFTDLLGTFTDSDLQHFDSPANGQLRHLGTDPRDYNITAGFQIEGPANDVISLRVTKWDDSAASFVTVTTQSRQAIFVVFSRNIATYELSFPVTLDQNDYLKLEVANEDSGLGSMTGVLDSFFYVGAR